jgi:thiamine-phosphate pyrophosphorylase
LRLDKRSLLLYAVTDRRDLGAMKLDEAVRLAIEGGATMIQLREKDLSSLEYAELGRSILDVCRKGGVPLIVNDDVEAAIILEAEGVHVGQSDLDAKSVRGIIGDRMILGVSAETVEQAIKAEAEGADYIGVGAMFRTSTKSDAGLVGIETLKDICSSVSIPVVAIGGISEDNLHMLAGTGIAGISVVSAIFSAECPRKAAKELVLKMGGLVT